MYNLQQVYKIKKRWTRQWPTSCVQQLAAICIQQLVTTLGKLDIDKLQYAMKMNAMIVIYFTQ